MVEDNLKDFTVNWAIFGLLFTCLIGFAITFMFYNNPSGYGLNDGSSDIFDSSYSGMNSSIYEIESNSDEILNITSQTNPEVSELGSRDSVATSFEGYGSGRSFWNSAVPLIKWIFSGQIGEILLTVFGGLIAWIGGYYLYKYIRTGT